MGSWTDGSGKSFEGRSRVLRGRIFSSTLLLAALIVLNASSAGIY